MAELLHNFLSQRCRFDGEDFTFRTFKLQWKKHRMQYIFLTKHKNERLSHFMQECNEYLTDRIYYNTVNHKTLNIDFQLSTYCIYILYALITNQPCFENNAPPTYIHFPEYIWKSLAHLIQFSERSKVRDLSDILKHMIQSHYFIYCIERPIVYSTHKTDPYSKNGKTYCHNTRSRLSLTPTDLVSVMDVPMLRSHKNRYTQSLKKCGNNFKDTDDTFIDRLRKIRSNYQQKLHRLQKDRIESNAHNQLEKMQFPLQFKTPKPMKAETLKEYYECCDGYKRAMDVFTLDRAAKVANEIGGDSKEEQSNEIMDLSNIPNIPAIPDLNLQNMPNIPNIPLLPMLDLESFKTETVTTQPLPLPPLPFVSEINNANSIEWGEDSDSEDEQALPPMPIPTNTVQSNAVVMDVDSGSETESETETNDMFAISAKNNAETLDILRSLEQMEESVTNKKLEVSTIEQLDINWKNHRKQSESGAKKGKKKKAKERKKSPKRKRKKKSAKKKSKAKNKKEKNKVASDDDIDFDDMYNNIIHNQNSNNSSNTNVLSSVGIGQESNDTSTENILKRLTEFSSTLDK